MNRRLIRILKKEVCRLVREERGVALMLTVSVILLLYVLCAGVYVYGENIRQKIELQNACDAAAYSAACVQADGLSRIALINRAMSWTYVQLTNLQLDYITWNFLSEVSSRFHEDQKKCKSWNDWTCGVSACGCDFFLYSRYRGENKGWFCGVANAGSGIDDGAGKVRVNGKVVTIDQVDKAVSDMASTVGGYAETIRALKKQIAGYNEFLKIISSQTSLSIKDTAAAVLKENLHDRADIEYYIDSKPMASPYLQWEEGYDENIVQETFFHPLFNTESDERIFLSMADNVVYDRLEPYFSNGITESFESGGLDQWFIRSTVSEACADAEEVKPTEQSFAAPGITRVYKNTNRSEFPFVRRGHHVNSSVSIGNVFQLNLNIDVPPSCLHSRDLYAHQCASVNRATSLYADWDWCSFQMHWCCYWSGKIPIPHHTEYGLVMPPGMYCNHVCCISPFSHKRSKYDSCFVNPLKLVNDERAIAYKHRTFVHPNTDLQSLMKNPFGHGRLYGDDKSLFNADTYTGQTAKPWILSPEFFSRKGAIVVGLKRTQRNVFENLFGAAGIYSAFDPKADGAQIAFSAARAAFRHPANGAGTREYEVRYDAVCHNNDDQSVFHLNGAGCVCGNAENTERFRRCWNLCTTDWDATLLPLAYSDAAASTSDGKYFDSYAGNTSTEWESIDARARDTEWLSPFEMAAALPNWRRFDDDSDGSGHTGEFMLQRPPSEMSSGDSRLNLRDLIKMRIL